MCWSCAMAEPAGLQGAFDLEAFLREAECEQQQQFDDGSNVAVLSHQGWTHVLLRNQAKPKTVRVRVPWLSFEKCHKVVELVCAEEPWCLARCDRSCRGSFDLWYIPRGPGGMPVGPPPQKKTKRRRLVALAAAIPYKVKGLIHEGVWMPPQGERA